MTGSYDPELNLTYWGTGNPIPANGATRRGDNLYSDSVIALDADTGKLRWHYQFMPHDEVDWDSAQIPVLIDAEWQGRPRKLMVWSNRNGVMYVFDRTSGEFLRGQPFVEVNWLERFEQNGRPVFVPGKLKAPDRTAPGYELAIAVLQPSNWPRVRLSAGTECSGSWQRRRRHPRFRSKDRRHEVGVQTKRRMVFLDSHDGVRSALQRRVGRPWLGRRGKS